MSLNNWGTRKRDRRPVKYPLVEDIRCDYCEVLCAFPIRVRIAPDEVEFRCRECHTRLTKKEGG